MARSLYYFLFGQKILGNSGHALELFALLTALALFFIERLSRKAKNEKIFSYRKSNCTLFITKLHNHWIKENNIDAVYEKKLIKEVDIEKIISEIRNGKIEGINVTVPYKQLIIPFLDEATSLARETKSVNTIYKKANKIIGENTDASGFKNSLEHIKYSVKGKKFLF